VRAETRAAARAARIAQRIADSHAGAGDIRSKGGIDIVTRADIACEVAIRAELRDAFPEYAVVGEDRGYAYLARGSIAGLVHSGFGARAPPVHTAAGCLLAQELGAWVTDIDDGEPWRLESRSFLIAADPTLHRDLRA
jgi:fructose-1,6-bisphosphatase/inositol monophosphatase family enzyme